MKIWIYFVKAPRRVTVIGSKRSYTRFKRSMIRVKIALSQEKQETKEMLSTYKKYTLREATPEEMQIANKQLRDILKGLGLGVFAILPFAPITIPILIKLGRIVGVEILPSSFSENGTKSSDK